MWQRIRRAWPSGPVGFSAARLESGDFTAAASVTALGLPATFLGATLALGGIPFNQLILAAPLAILLGGFLLGLGGRMASATGAPGPWLLRPALGSAGSIPAVLSRLALTIGWGALIIQQGGRWAADALGGMGLGVQDQATIIGLGVLVGVLALTGPSFAITVVMRRWLFWGAVIMLFGLAWRLLSMPPGPAAPAGSSNFWAAFETLLTLGLIWLPFGTDVGSLGRREENTGNGLGYGFAVGALLAVWAGGAVVAKTGSLDRLDMVAPGALGAFAVLLWVLIMEVDGGAASGISSAYSLSALIPRLPGWAGAIVAAAGATALAVLFTDEQIRLGTDLALVGASVGAALFLTDAYLVRGRHYGADDMFRWRGEYRLFNWLGLLAWVLGVGFILWARPTGPQPVAEFFSRLPGGDLGASAPWLLVGMAVAAVFYALTGRSRLGGRGRTFRMRGLQTARGLGS
jgi:purine-cytosine permease-like protein